MLRSGPVTALVLQTLFVAVSLLQSHSVSACPFCAAASLTLSEQLHQSDVAVLVKWTGGEPANRDKKTFGSTNCQIVEVVQDSTGKVQVGEKLVLDTYRAGKVGDLMLLAGTKGTQQLDWSSPLNVSDEAYQYLKHVPPKGASRKERLTYCLKFLEAPDPMIALDAFNEFANASYKEVAQVTEHLSRENLRKWLSDAEVERSNRVALYGLMLGLCGKAEDAEFLKAKIMQNTTKYRLGLDGVMFGYLQLSGEEGLQVIEQTKLEDKQAPFSETYSALQALRVMWTDSDRISKERLRVSLRLLLDRPDLADFIVTDITRWEDWDSVDRLMKMYADPAYQVQAFRRNVLRFLLIADRKAQKLEGEIPDSLKKCQAALAKLKTDEPEAIKKAAEFLFVD